MPERNAQLVEWEAKYQLGSLSMSTPTGILWEDRGKASEAYFNDYSWDWESNLELLVDVRAMAEKFGGDYMMLAYAIAQNFISDVYYKNPEPFIQDKDGNRDLSRMLTDMARSIHNNVNSERKMQDGLQDQFWAGFGMVYVTMRQEWDGVSALPRSQRIIVKQLSPWEVRLDPRGREWDLSDHSYIRILITPKMSQVMMWSWLTDDDRARVVAWNKMGMRDEGGPVDSYNAQRIDYPLMADNEETDPDVIEIPMWVNWDRTKQQVVYQPAGARFTLTPQPWPEEFVTEDDGVLYPVVYMARNREPRNKRGTSGFIGIPDIRSIRPHLMTIRRLRALFVAANQHAIFKYLSPEGALKQQVQDKLGTDQQWQILEWDPEAFEKFPTTMRDRVNVEDILRLVQQPDLKETRHLVGIQHELNMIAQILGQSSGDRGGMPDTETATDSVIINRRLEQRLTTMRHEASKHYVALTKLIFLILQKRQVLPIKYQMTTQFNQQVWTAFQADDLRDLELHFDVAVGSSEPRTREREFELRERMAAILMPVLQARGDVRGMMKVARDLIEVLDVSGTEQYFNDEAIMAARELAALMYAIQKGEVDPADPNVLARQMQLIGAILNAMLTPQDMTEMMAERAGKAAPESSGGTGSVAKPLTAGEQAYADGESGAMGSAAAGAIGGMA